LKQNETANSYLDKYIVPIFDLPINPNVGCKLFEIFFLFDRKILITKLVKSVVNNWKQEELQTLLKKIAKNTNNGFKKSKPIIELFKHRLNFMEKNPYAAPGLSKWFKKKEQDRLDSDKCFVKSFLRK